MEATNKTLGELIKQMRTAKGLTMAELAEEANSDASAICKWEHGASISWYKFLEIAQALGYITDIEVNGGAE